jgi:hypothetical protein
MLTNKRKFKRFDLPLIVKFRHSNGATDYTLGLTKNFSCEGLGLEAPDFDFMLKENLELNLKFPKSGSAVSLIGDVVWKRRLGDKSLAGIKIKMDGKDIQSDMIEKISSHANIPVNNIYSKDNADIILLKKKGKAASKLPEKKSKPLSAPSKLGFVKQYLKSGSLCKVTFRLPKDAAPDAQQVTIVGDFNGWDTTITPLTRLKNGDFSITLDLESNKDYRFKYFIDGDRWENDWKADVYAPNDFGTDDSVVIV